MNRMAGIASSFSRNYFSVINVLCTSYLSDLISNINMDLWNYYKAGRKSGQGKSLSIVGLTTLFSLAFSLQASASAYSPESGGQLKTPRMGPAEVALESRIERNCGFQ